MRLACLIQPFLVVVMASSSMGAEFTILGKTRVHPTRVLARFTDPAALRASNATLSSLGFRGEDDTELAPGLVVLEFEGPKRKTAGRPDGLVHSPATLLEGIRVLRRSGLFEYVEPDYLVSACRLPGDARFVDGTLWGLRNSGSNGGVAGADIDAVRAWEISTGSTNVIVAVVDSGIRYTHQELASQMWRNPGEVPDNGVDDDGDGRVDNVHGITVFSKWGDPYDESGHGTHIAGTIGAAADDGNPHVGVAWQVRLMACKFIDPDGFGFTSDAIRCIEFATSKGARIINASWTSGPYSQSLFDAISRARDRGVLFVAAAGNDGFDLDMFPSYPACYGLENIISVAALDRRDSLAPSSNFGKTTVHLGAPGHEIFSTAAGSNQAYATLNGTSMVAPFVSGVAALVLGHYHGASISEIRNRLISAAVPIPELRDKTITGGRLNAYGALTARPDGNLEVTLRPLKGTELRAGAAIALSVTVSDLGGQTDAMVTGQIDGMSEPLIFQNAGLGSDGQIASDTYVAKVIAPTDRPSLVLKLRINAPAKSSYEETIVYPVVSPPTNDNFADAAIIPSEGGVFNVTNRLATIETGEPLHARAASCVASVWWRWSPAAKTRVMIDTSGSSFDTVLAVYTNDTLGTLKEIASVDDSEEKKQGYLIFEAISGVTYHVAVAGYSPLDMGTVRLRVQPSGAPDLRAPEVSIANPLSGMTVTNAVDNTIVIAGTASDPEPHASGVEEVLVRVNDKPPMPAFGTVTWIGTNRLDLGENTIKVTAVDFARNASSAQSLTIFYRPLLSPNDLFVNSTELLGTQGTAIADNTAATRESGEQTPADVVTGKSVWWHFQPRADGVLTLSTENSNFDAFLGLYLGNHHTNLTMIAESDGLSPGAGFSQIRQAVKAFETYRIVVDGRTGSSGTVNLSYSFKPMAVFHLSITNTVGGSVDLRSGYYVGGEHVVASASPAPNYQLDAWEGTLTSRENPLTIVMTNDIVLVPRFQPYEFSDGFESGDFGRLNWTNSSEAPWVVQDQIVAFGRFAVRSGRIGNGESSVLRLVENCRAGVGSFDLRSSSEAGWDFLEFLVNGRRVNRWSGEGAWLRYEFVVPESVNVFEWRYAKDASGTSAGLDAVFIDNVELPLVVKTDSTTPAHLRLQRLSPYALRLMLDGQSKQQYTIQVSDNLTTWSNLSRQVATNGVAQVTNAIPPNVPIRFYRAVVP